MSYHFVCMHVYFVLFLFSGLFSFVDFPLVLWYCSLGLLTCKNRLPYNLYCVGGDVKHCTIQSNTVIGWSIDWHAEVVECLHWVDCLVSTEQHRAAYCSGRQNGKWARVSQLSEEKARPWCESWELLLLSMVTLWCFSVGWIQHVHVFSTVFCVILLTVFTLCDNEFCWVKLQSLDVTVELLWTSAGRHLSEVRIIKFVFEILQMTFDMSVSCV